MINKVITRAVYWLIVFQILASAFVVVIFVYTGNWLGALACTGIAYINSELLKLLKEET